MDLTGNQFENIATVVTALVALSLALSAAIGPSVMLITEAVKAGFNLRPGWGGIAAIVVSVALCALVGVITASLTDAGDYVSLSLLGAVVGLFVGAGAIRSHKEAGTVNVEVSSDIQEGTERRTSETLATLRGYEELARPMAFAFGQPDETVNRGDGTYQHTWGASRIVRPTPDDLRGSVQARATPFDLDTDDSPEDEDLDAAILAGPGEAASCSVTPDSVDTEDGFPDDDGDESPRKEPPAITFHSGAA